MATAARSGETSEDTKSIVTVLLLIFMTPIGIIVMWFWPKWPAWLKTIITLIIVGSFMFMLFIFGAMFAGIFSAISEEQSRCTKLCESAKNSQLCTTVCSAESNPNPKLVTEFTPESLFVALNEERINRGLSEIKKDEKLCTLAKRLADKYISDGKDPKLTFDDDMNNPQVNAQYFNKYSKVSENNAKDVSYSTYDLPAEFRTPSENNYALSNTVTHGCFAVEPSRTPDSYIITFAGGLIR